MVFSRSRGRAGRWLIVSAVLAGAASWAHAGTDQAGTDLAGEVAGLLEQHCASCHSPQSRSLGGVDYRGDFDSALDLGRLRESSWVDLEQPELSELWYLVAEGDMPPDRAVVRGEARLLTEEESGKILAWIEAGAPLPGGQVSGGGELMDGERAFFAACTSCHPASRALGKVKDRADWRATVLRMAEKPDARVPTSQVDAIAAYLAEESRLRAERGGLSSLLQSGSLDDLSVHATVSAVWRDSGRDERLENPDFFGEAWIGAVFHPAGNPVSVSVTACTTCHLSGEAEGRPIELVEASLAVDLDQALGSGDGPLQAAFEAGRFVVPFGAFASRSNPAAYRTVSRPLLYNMGQGVDRSEMGAPLLPAPYSDEGVLLSLGGELGEAAGVGLDLYAVNGLQGTFGLDLHQSRAWSDNNGDVAVGGRFTIKDGFGVTLGASAMTGNMEASAGALAGRLGYYAVGLDVSARIGRRVGISAEVARRRNDQLVFPSFTRTEAEVEGYVVEGDLLLLEERGLSLIARVDFLRYEGGVAPLTSSLSADRRMSRFTWGFDLATWGGSSLMVNHERWWMPEGLEDLDLVGARWVASF